MLGRLFPWAIVALMAACALAAPTPTKSLQKRSFTVPVRPRTGSRRSPRDEMIRTYGKYGWKIVLSNPNESDGNPWASLLASLFPSAFPEASSAAPQPAATSARATASAGSSAGSSGSGSGSNGTSTSATSTASSSGNSSSSSSSGEIGEVSAVPETNDSEYLETVAIGTSPQTLNLDFDTGSSDLYVYRRVHGNDR